jgi:hypothetical protein
MTDKEIIKFYHEKKIFYVRLEFIKDFLFYLLDVVDRTFLGDDLMTIQNKKEHFEYCLDYTTEQFKSEKITINSDVDFNNFLFDVFFKYYYDTKKTKKNIEDFKIRLNVMLSYSLTKKKAQLEEMDKYYEIFSKNLGNYLIF